MTKWAYTSIYTGELDTNEKERKMNDLGNQGWELVVVTKYRMYFKRSCGTEPFNPERR